MSNSTISRIAMLMCMAFTWLFTAGQGTSVDKGVLVFSENFNLFIAGSELSPSDIDLADSYSGAIDPSMTQYPGWSGAAVFSAGGSCYVGQFTDPYYGETIDGYLNAPHGDYSGEITFKFRARHNGGMGSSKIHLTVASGSASLGGFSGELGPGWQEYTGTFTVTDARAKTSYIQFSSDPGVTFFLDDIEVYRKKGEMLPPEVLPYSDATPTSFKARWNRHSDARSFLLSVYTKTPDPANDEVTENFDSVTSTELTQTLPSGVQLDLVAGGGATFTSVYKTQPNAVLFDATGDAITTPVKTGRLLKWVKFWAKPHVLDAPTGRIVLNCLVSGKWQDLGTIEIFHFVDGQQVLIQEQLPDGAQALKIGFERGNSDLSIDNLSFGYDPVRDYVMLNKEISATSYLVEGVDLGKHDYYYRLKAKNGTEVSASSKEIRVDFLPAPQVQEATDITTHSFRPQWTFPEKAQGGVLYNYMRHTAKERGVETIVEDNFDKVSGTGTPENPEVLSEGQKTLDAYTQQPGWLGSRIALANGMIGAKGWGGLVQSPTMTLGNAQGKYTLEVTAYCPEDNTDLTVKSVSGEDVQKQVMTFVQAGKQSQTIEFTNGAENTVITFSTTAGEPFFIDDVAVKQQLEAGDSYRMLTHNNVLIDVPADGSSPCTLVLDNLMPGEEYEYNLLAYTRADGNVTLSDLSDFQTVKLPEIPSSVNAIGVQDAEVFKLLNQATLQVMEAGKVAVFDTVGHCVMVREMKENETLSLNLPTGAYIVKHSSGACIKVMLP